MEGMFMFAATTLLIDGEDAVRVRATATVDQS